MSSQQQRKLQKARQIADRCYFADIKPPAWVRHLLNPRRSKAA